MNNFYSFFGSGFNWVSESKLGIRIRIQAGQNCPPKKQNPIKFNVWRVWAFFVGVSEDIWRFLFKNFSFCTSFNNFVKRILFWIRIRIGSEDSAPARIRIQKGTVPGAGSDILVFISGRYLKYTPFSYYSMAEKRQLRAVFVLEMQGKMWDVFFEGIFMILSLFSNFI